MSVVSAFVPIVRRAEGGSADVELVFFFGEVCRLRLRLGRFMLQVSMRSEASLSDSRRRFSGSVRVPILAKDLSEKCLSE